MVVRELLTKLGFEADQSKIDKFENSVGNLTKGLSLLVSGATAAATAAFGFASSVARQSEEIARSAKLASTGVEEFQKLAYASEAFGIEQDKLADILKDTNDKIGDFFQTGAGPLADFFEFIAPKIGVTAEQFKNLSGADALQLYVSSLEKANLSQAEMTFYMEAIASDSTLLLPLLEKNGEAYKALAKEAEEYGYVLSKETIEQNRKLRLELWSLSKMIDSLYTNIGNRFIPLFSDLIKRFKEFIKENRELIQTKLNEFFEGAIWVSTQFINVLSTLSGWINNITQTLGGWENVFKIIGVAIGTLLASRFIGWAIKAYAAVRSLNSVLVLLTAGIVAARIAAIALTGWFFLLKTAIILLIEDIYQWVSGNESAIGDLLGSWEDFKNKFIGYLSDSVEAVKEKLNTIYTFFTETFTKIKDYVSGIFNDMWSGISNGIDGAINKLKSYIPDINLNPFSSNTPKPTTESVLGVGGIGTSSVINDNKNINITVPPGTTTEQIDAIKLEINKTMAQQYTDAAIHLEGY